MNAPLQAESAVARRSETLLDVIEYIDKGDIESAHRILKHVLAHVDIEGSPDALAYYIFGAALARRISDTVAEETNLYLANYDVPQIRLFNLMATRMPLVSMSAEMANRTLLHFCRGRDQATVIDIGIGTGRQMVALIEMLAGLPDRPRKLCIVGIEPMDWGLQQAEANLYQVCSQRGIDFEFRGIHNVVECLSDDERQLIRDAGPRPIINASFALHHIQDIDQHNVRDAVLMLLRSLDPAALVLSEPCSDHLCRNLRQRFVNCWAHFGATFRVIDELDIEQRDKDSLKVGFFGREISDILGNPEDTRTERHEHVDSWLARLRRSGYRPSLPLTPTVSADTRSDARPHIDAAVHDGYIGLDYQGETIVSVICAVPDNSFALPERFLPSRERARVLPRYSALDSRVYMAALVAIAKADGFIHEREKRFLTRQASMLDVAIDAEAQPESLWNVGSLDEVLGSHEQLSAHTREAILRDVVLLAMLDGEYAASERVEVRAIAHKLGFTDDKVTETEKLSRVYLPSELSATPSWFQETWVLCNK